MSDAGASFLFKHIQYIRLIDSDAKRPFYFNNIESSVQQCQEAYPFLPARFRKTKTWSTLGFNDRAIPSFLTVATRCLALINSALVNEAWWLPTTSSDDE